MHYLMAGQGAGTSSAIVGNRHAIVRPNHVNVKIHQALSTHVRRIRSHAMSGVADRTGKPILRYVAVMLGPTGIGKNLMQIVTLSAHRVRAIHAQVRIGKSIRHRPSGDRSLTELVVVLKDVRVYRSVGPVGSVTTKLAVVIATVAVRAEDARPRGSRRNRPVLIQHVRQQAGLW